MSSVNATHSRPSQPVPEHILGVDIGLVSPTSQGTVSQAEHVSAPLAAEDYTAYMDAMAANLQAPQWLSPSTVTWDIWNNLVGCV